MRWLLGLAALITVPIGLMELVTPNVDQAPERVVAIDRAAGAVPVMISLDAPIARSLMAAEDANFLRHHGIDGPAAARAFWGLMIQRDLGGTTIDDQLAKVVYLNGATDVLSRLSEIALALKLDGHYSKSAILSMYLDAVYFGHGFTGVTAASQGYFGLAPEQLSWGQAALLAGLPQAPSALDPFRHLAAARTRQRYVLDRLVSEGQLTAAEADAAAAAPLHLLTA